MEIDRARQPVVITLRRDSLGLGPTASADDVADAMRAAASELTRVAAFDLLAVSPAIFALNVRPRDPGSLEAFLSSLRRHRLVAEVEVSGVARIP